MLFNGTVFGEVGFDPLQQFHAQLLVSHLTTAESQRYLGLVPFAEEAHQVAKLDLIIAVLGSWTELDFLDLNLFLILLGCCLLLLLFEQVLAVIHDATNWRKGFGGNFHQIQLYLFRELQGFVDSDDADLFAIRTDQADLTSTDIFIDRGLGCPFVLFHFTLNSHYSDAWRPRRETACVSNSRNCSMGMLPRSVPSRVRTATDRVSTSRSPITRR